MICHRVVGFTGASTCKRMVCGLPQVKQACKLSLPRCPHHHDAWPFAVALRKLQDGALGAGIDLRRLCSDWITHLPEFKREPSRTRQTTGRSQYALTHKAGTCSEELCTHNYSKILYGFPSRPSLRSRWMSLWMMSQTV